MICEDCKGPIELTTEEVEAQSHGLTICQSCLESMCDEADAYEQEMREAGVKCVFDIEHGFRIVPLEPAVRADAAQGEGRQDG